MVTEDVARLFYYHARYNDFIQRNVPHLRSYVDGSKATFVNAFDSLFAAVESLAEQSRGRLAAEHERFLEQEESE